jgi:vitamin B12 transporter
MRLLMLLAGASALAFPTASHAQQDLADDPGITMLETIVVTGSRAPIEEGSLGRAITVVTSEELEARQVKTVAEALRQVPGVAVSRAGGQTAVRVRGAEANHVLVMIDGIETAGASDGFEFADLIADEIERIEILRGPQSSLWGAGATAGVINIVTKSGPRNGRVIETFAEGGTNGSHAGGASVRGGNDRADGAVSLTYRNEGGWDLSGDGGGKDGYRNLALRAKANVDLSEDLTLRLAARFADRRVEYDDAGADFSCSDPSCYVSEADNLTTGRDAVLGLSADYRMLGGVLVHTPSFSFASRTNESTTLSFGDSSNEATTLKAGHQIVYAFDEEDRHKLIGVAEFKQETFVNSYAGDDTKRRGQFGTVLEYRGEITDRWFVQLSGRHDWNDDFADAATWAASTSYNFFETDTRLHASAGKGVTNPTFIELYGFIPGQFVGNANLVPEENIGFDVGVEQSFFDGRLVVDVTYFNETLTNEIQGSGTTVVNLDGKSDRQGVEVALAVNPTDDLTIKASYTYLDATEPDGTREIRRPRHLAGINVGYRFLDGRATIGTDIAMNAGLFDADFSDPAANTPPFIAPKVRLDDYVKVDVYGSYKFSEQAELYGKVVNLFDADYQEVLGYSVQPLTAYFGIKSRF